MGEDFQAARAGIASRQLRRLQSLIERVAARNRFQKEKWDRANALVPNVPEHLSEFAARFPFTTKAELGEDQRLNSPYGTNLTFEREEYTRCHQTSGTTGEPLIWLDTAEDWEWMTLLWGEVYAAAGVTARDSIFFAFSFGPFLGFWLAFSAAARLGCLIIPGGGLSSSHRLQAILRHGATVLCCTPTYALRLAEVAASEGIDLRASKVRLIIVAGEAGGSVPSVREKLSQAWNGARIFDHHGMTEVGPVTYECPEKPGRLHVMEDGYLAEVVNPETGRAAGLGEVGELILTPLGRAGSPLFRYRTGDLVKASFPPLEDGGSYSPCACGKALVGLEGGILGRADEMIIVRGVNIYPAAVEEILRSCGGIAEYRIHVNTGGTLARMSIEIELGEGNGDAGGTAALLEKKLMHAFALKVPVTVAPGGTLPRFEMKAKRWVRTAESKL